MAGSGEGCYVGVAPFESVVEPDCVADNRWRESVSLIRIHLPIISVAVSLLVSTHLRHPV